ncbi:MAG: toxin-antitoxin system YwqK family antitoxin [Bacteroidota bacterium]|nr:toxin-antitoxin system YwqK family antitoxin [Bacteroidota bacterium]
MHRLLLLLLMLGWCLHVSAQNTVTPNGKTVFKYPNGNISSEGMMRDGKPDGYWKTYYENNILKSEGNRKNFELDSTWKFYDEKGKLTLEINYKNGKKNGLRKSYRETEFVTENFVDDLKQGPTTYYYPDGKLCKVINFENGLEVGTSKEYAEDGTIISITEYKKGFIVDREYINKTDKAGKKQGKWKYFYDNDVVKLEGVYKDDLKNGYFKEYDKNGLLLSIKKYVNDVEEAEAVEVSKLVVKSDYYSNGQIKTTATYRGDVPEGVRREYDQNGKIVQGFVFKNGAVVGEGVVNEDGVKDGNWKEYYDGGKLRAVGAYDKGKQVGEWVYYYPDGKVEQRGKFSKTGKYEGNWKWYFPDGSLKRDESYLNGVLDGPTVEYDEFGNVIRQGEYIEGLEDGKWISEVGEYREEGVYKAGLRKGIWRFYYISKPGGNNKQLFFEGGFIDGLPNGKHVYYWDNGNKKDEGTFVMGRKEGDWTKYNYEGSVFLMISYKGGIEKKYDGIVIKPELKEL